MSRIFISEVLNWVSEVSQLASQNRSFLKFFGITDYGNDFKKKAGDNCPRNNMNRYDLTSLLPLSVFLYTIYAAIICLLKGTKSYRIFEDLVSFYHVIVSSGRLVENSPERDCCW